MLSNILQTVGTIQTYQIMNVNGDVPPYSYEARVIDDYLQVFNQFGDCPFPGVDVINNLSTSIRIDSHLKSSMSGMSSLRFDKQYNVDLLYNDLSEFRVSILSKSNRKMLDTIKKVKDLEFLKGIKVKPLDGDIITTLDNGKITLPSNIKLDFSTYFNQINVDIVQDEVIKLFNKKNQFKIVNSNEVLITDILLIEINRDMDKIIYMEEDYVKSIQNIFK